MLTGYEAPPPQIEMGRGEVDALSLPWGVLQPKSEWCCATARSICC